MTHWREGTCRSSFSTAATTPSCPRAVAVSDLACRRPSAILLLQSTSLLHRPPVPKAQLPNGSEKYPARACAVRDSGRRAIRGPARPLPVRLSDPALAWPSRGSCLVCAQATSTTRPRATVCTSASPRWTRLSDGFRTSTGFVVLRLPFATVLVSFPLACAQQQADTPGTHGAALRDSSGQGGRADERSRQASPDGADGSVENAQRLLSEAIR